jgi:hypothetical protein
MPVPAPNKLFQLLAGGLAKELPDRRVVLILDPAEELRPFLDEVATEEPEPGGFGSIGAPPSLPLSPWRNGGTAASAAFCCTSSSPPGGAMSCLRSRPSPLPLGKDPIAQAPEGVRGLRHDHPGPYATIAAAIDNFPC